LAEICRRAPGLDSSFFSGEARLAGVEVLDFVFFSGRSCFAGVQDQKLFLLRPRPAWPEEPAPGTVQNKKQHAITSNLADGVLFFIAFII
jgi:hypothetical protein